MASLNPAGVLRNVPERDFFGVFNRNAPDFDSGTDPKFMVLGGPRIARRAHAGVKNLLEKLLLTLYFSGGLEGSKNTRRSK
jgi:hypothetical protein